MLFSSNRTYIYLDNAATTPLCDAAAEAMAPYMKAAPDGAFGNANSLHSIGREAFSELEDARVRVARALGGSTSRTKSCSPRGRPKRTTPPS